MPEFEDYPLYFYLSKSDGRYVQPRLLKDRQELDEAMKGVVAEHVRRGLEVRITNRMDGLVFHSHGGKVVWPVNRRLTRKAAAAAG
jgi:hypothetical protein